MIRTNKDGYTALHRACQQNENVSVKIISKLLDVGGRELLMMNDKNGYTALWYWGVLCENENVLSAEIVSNFLEVGGKELVMMTDQYKFTVLHHVCKNRNVSVDVVSKLL